MSMRLDDINIGIQSQFHMLRHFVGITPELRDELLAAGRTKEAIEKELNEPGSRFYPDFAHDIKGLLTRILDNGYQEETGSNGNMILKGSADPSIFSKGVGTLSVAHLQDIPEQQRDRIYFKENRGVDLMHFQVVSLPSTHEYTIILKPTESSLIFITAFPGPPAMPLPDFKMEKSLFEVCELYWNQHVFLVEGETENNSL